jgi:hypothetical protein
MLVSVAGRVARAFIAESEGVYRPHWTIDDVGENIDAIRNADRQWSLDPVPLGFVEHLQRSFAMAKGQA